MAVRPRRRAGPCRRGGALRRRAGLRRARRRHHPASLSATPLALPDTRHTRIGFGRARTTKRALRCPHAACARSTGPDRAATDARRRLRGWATRRGEGTCRDRSIQSAAGVARAAGLVAARGRLAARPGLAAAARRLVVVDRHRPTRDRPPVRSPSAARAARPSPSPPVPRSRRSRSRRSSRSGRARAPSYGAGPSGYAAGSAPAPGVRTKAGREYYRPASERAESSPTPRRSAIRRRTHLAAGALDEREIAHAAADVAAASSAAAAGSPGIRLSPLLRLVGDGSGVRAQFSGRGAGRGRDLRRAGSCGRGGGGAAVVARAGPPTGSSAETRCRADGASSGGGATGATRATATWRLAGRSGLAVRVRAAPGGRGRLRSPGSTSRR